MKEVLDGLDFLPDLYFIVTDKEFDLDEIMNKSEVKSLEN
jgi:hypothetical protein